MKLLCKHVRGFVLIIQCASKPATTKMGSEMTSWRNSTVSKMVKYLIYADGEIYIQVRDSNRAGGLLEIANWLANHL